jgi:hypothetical protein
MPDVTTALAKLLVALILMHVTTRLLLYAMMATVSITPAAPIGWLVIINYMLVVMMEVVYIRAALT